MGLRKALVLTVSDGVSAGTRQDDSGSALEAMLTDSGFAVDRAVVPDEQRDIVAAIEDGVRHHDLILTTGGTGFGPRDVTPEATSVVLDREAPGLVHLMLSKGMEATPMAALSRATAGTRGSTLIVNLPGSPKGASENLTALLGVLPHALDLIAGHTEHG